MNLHLKSLALILILGSSILEASVDYEYVGVSYQNPDGSDNIDWESLKMIDKEKIFAYNDFLLANIQFTDEVLIFDALEIFADQEGFIDTNTIENEICQNVTIGSCADLLYKSNEPLSFTFGANIIRFSLNRGYNMLNLSQKYIVPKRSFLRLTFQSGGKVAFASNIGSNQTDYILNKDGFDYNLLPLNPTESRKFYARAHLTQVNLNTPSAQYGKLVPNGNVSSDNTYTFTNDMSFYVIVLQNSTFEEDSILTNFEIYSMESITFTFGHVKPDACAQFDLESSCLDYLSSVKSVATNNVNLLELAQINSRDYSLVKGYNKIVLNEPIYIVKGSFLVILPYETDFSLVIDKKNVSQADSDFYFQCNRQSCTRTSFYDDIPIKFNIQVNFINNFSDKIKIGDPVPYYLSIPNYQYYVIEGIYFENDAIIYGYELFSINPGYLLIGLFKDSNCSGDFCYLSQTSNYINESDVSFYNHHSIYLTSNRTLYSFLTIKPIYVKAGSFLYLQHEDDGNGLNGRVALENDATYSDLIVNCTPVCYSVYPLDSTSKTRFLMRALTANLLNASYYGNPIPQQLSPSEYTTIDSTSIDEKSQTCFILNNIKLVDQGVLTSIEIYSAEAGVLAFDLMNYTCYIGCPDDLLGATDSLWILYSQLGVQFNKFDSFVLNVSKGYNIHYFDVPMYYYENSYLVMYQYDARVSIKTTSDNSDISDYLVYNGNPYTVYTSSLVRLSADADWHFMIRVKTNRSSLYSQDETSSTQSMWTTMTTQSTSKPNQYGIWEWLKFIIVDIIFGGILDFFLAIFN